MKAAPTQYRSITDHDNTGGPFGTSGTFEVGRYGRDLILTAAAGIGMQLHFTEMQNERHTVV